MRRISPRMYFAYLLGAPAAGIGTAATLHHFELGWPILRVLIGVIVTGTILWAAGFRRGPSNATVAPRSR
jgi:hypothetical protein